MANYFSYRITLSQPSQLNMFVERKSKAEFLFQVIALLEGSIKQSFTNDNKRFLLYYVRRIDGSSFLLQLAREDRITQPKEGERGVEDSEAVITPNIFFILDVATQIILIQNKTSVFSTNSTAANRIADFFENRLSEYQVTARVEPITRADDVWVEIESALEVQSLELDIDPPNLFGGRFKSNIDIKEAHEETNFTKFKILIQNKFGQLKLQKENFQDLLQTIASGAGKFVVSLVDEIGNFIQISNLSRIWIVYIPDDPNLIDPEKLRADLEVIDKLNEINKPSDVDTKLLPSQTIEEIPKQELKTEKPIKLSKPPKIKRKK